ncbi:MAG: GyrI-like domain-containing protein [Bacteroidales bacterium]|jgi:effector-binding domain-containing protein|nr:GyrI-like domain-containing protein [Bacteroidales bacterium]MDY0369261.1 GyrI-like domain-containing protein [Bacteroidales bacterium]
MRVLKFFGSVFFILTAVIFILPLFMSDHIEVRNSLWMQTDVKTVFRHVNSLRLWPEWSPFEWADTNLRLLYSGPETGQGSRLEWIGNRNDTQSIEVIRSEPYKLIQNVLDMKQGGHAIDEWEFFVSGDSVEVVWTLKLTELAYPFHRYFGFFSGNLIAPMQVKGLQTLKELTEDKQQLPKVEWVELEPQPAVGITKIISQEEIPEMASLLLNKLETYMRQSRQQPVADLFVLIQQSDEPDKIEFTLAYPIPEEVTESGRVRYFIRPGGKAVRASFQGKYDEKTYVYDELQKFLLDHQMPISPLTIEIWLNSKEALLNSELWHMEMFALVE